MSEHSARAAGRRPTTAVAGASPAGRTLEMDALIPAPVETVWAAWTTPHGLRRWWWNHWPDVEIEVDARVGRGYRFAAPGAGIVVSGTYLDVREPTTLVFTWEWTDADGVQAGETVDVRFEETDGSTRLTLRHSGPWSDDAPAESYRQGWAFVLAALDSAVTPSR